ncbi:MAG TPA: hypothetical protein VM537_21305 [Anaerolineae bacterium]|nr:hypothetical protein [Anaerolineae bacterium]
MDDYVAMAEPSPAFASEHELVEAFCSALDSEQSPWGGVTHTREFGYKRGRTDIVALDNLGTILAFEAKLSRWRDALHQAYRNTCYAHLSYVVLPEQTAARARRHSREFEIRAVGLCCVSGGCIEVAIPASKHDPIQPWLSRLAAGQVECTNGA